MARTTARALLNPLFYSTTALSVALALSACQPPAGDAGQAATSDPSPDIYSDYVNRDVRDDVFYFVLPDRFDNGDPANDNGSNDKAISHGGFDPTNKGFFHGGDLQGLKKRLGYLKNMGVTAIWMTPILRNKAIQRDETGYHGYWIVDFSELDPHLGSNADLKDLIDSAHAEGIKVFFDIITNHTADVIKYRECHNEQGVHLESGAITCPYKSSADLAAGKEQPYTTFIPSGEENVKVPAWLNDPQYYHNQGDSFWEGESAMNGDFVGLDDLDTTNPQVVSGMIDIYKNIIATFHPDGFRVDTVKHVDMSFWQAFVPAIIDYAHEQGIPKFHLFGEVYTGDPAFLSRYTTIGKLPAVLDFGFQGNADAVFANNESPKKLQTLFDKDDYYNDADSQADLLPTFIGNHDMGRVGHFISKNLPDASDAEKMQRSILTHALMYFSRGIPVVYYGDEQGFTGDGGDMDAREDMMASQVASYNDNTLLGTTATTANENFDEQHPIYLKLKAFAQLLREHQTLRRGVHLTRFADSAPGIYAFSRVDTEEKVEYLLAFNSASEARQLSLPASTASYSAVVGSGDLVANDGAVSLTVAPLDFVIYRANDALPAPQNLAIASVSAEDDSGSPDFISLSIAVDHSPAAVPLLKVTTEYKNSAGEFELASVDYTAPYTSKIQRAAIAGGLNGEVKITVDNFAGETTSKVVKLGAE